MWFRRLTSLSCPHWNTLLSQPQDVLDISRVENYVRVSSGSGIRHGFESFAAQLPLFISTVAILLSNLTMLEASTLAPPH